MGGRVTEREVCQRCRQEQPQALRIGCYEPDREGVWQRHPACAIWAGLLADAIADRGPSWLSR